MENLAHWDRFADIDPKFTKAITGKPYKGTSPNPQYVIRCLTEMFGPVGQGFGWDIVAEDFTPLGGETLHWCRIKFWHTDRANTFDSYGQTKACYTTNAGKVMVDEDAPKKSLTDAIIKAASHIGIGANIFLGRWDDQKYVDQVDAEYRKEEKAATPRDPRKIADSLIGAVGKCQTYDAVTGAIGAEKFDAAWKWLEENHPPLSGEVKKAVNDARNRVDPAGQAPDERAA